MQLDLRSLQQMYDSGAATPSDVVAEIYSRIAVCEQPVWISTASRADAIARALDLEQRGRAGRPLYGIPFAIKDNIDLAGVPTTAACPGYSYMPERSATVVQRLVDAGAIPIGKTNMDQFATGLVGTRSPFGACSSVFDKSYISGGSSSGSAVAVAAGMATFSLGTDTAGSGRIPAAFNNLVGLKPTRGLLSARGVVPACRTLDCVSIFAANAADAHAVWAIARGFDTEDGYSRIAAPGDDASPWCRGEFTFGVPGDDQLEFFGDSDAAALFEQAVAAAERIGGRRVAIDFSVFRAAAELLYAGPWVAERYAALRAFVDEHADEMNPVVRGIIEGAKKYSAADCFDAAYRLADLRRAADAEWRKMDVLLLPTAGTIYTHEAISADPVRRNTNLGCYTNFVNLLDLAAVAVPAGFRPDGLPFGVSFIGPAFTDEGLLALADRFHRGCTAMTTGRGCVDVAVVGAHLSGQPLNWQLTDRGARLVRSCRTAAGYRLYALDGTVPAKPGLVRDECFSGPGIEVEVWAVPENQFGGFVAAIPPPLGIGSVTLDDGAAVKCFICEPYAISRATEITHHGGWRDYLAAARSTA